MRNSKLERQWITFFFFFIFLMGTPALASGTVDALDHYLWVSNFDDHTVSKVDVNTHEVVATIAVGENPAGIAVGLDFIYVVCTRSSSVYRITKDTDAVYDEIDMISVMEYPIGVAAYRDGYFFVVGRVYLDQPCPAQDTALAKVNSDGIIEASTPLIGICGFEGEIGIGLNLMGDGFVPWTRAWDMNTGLIHFSIDYLSFTNHDISYKYYRGPGVCVDGDGNGWSAGTRSKSYTANFTRLEPGVGLQHYGIPEELVGRDYSGGVLVDPQHSIWMGYPLGLFKLNPDTGQIDYFDVGVSNGGLALDINDYIWVAFPDDNELKKFDLDGNQVGSSVEVGGHPLGFGDMTGYEIDPICSDVDGDGYIDDEPACMGDDCDDGNPETYPGALEICDGRDNDCDGTVPDDETDLDGDTYVECAGWVGAVPGILGGGDCGGSDPAIHPETPEICDEIDWNCSGDPFDKDADGDGFIDDDPVCMGDDCDDEDSKTHPGATELCDGKDNDCDGSLHPFEIDRDGDGYVRCLPWLGDDPDILGGGDCDAAEPSTYPGADEICGDGIDNDCDGQTDEDFDLDQDGFTICDEPVADCDDADPETYPGAPELCDGMDNDCNGTVPSDEADADGDVWRICEGDCDDTDELANPGLVEGAATGLCDDGRDNDCDDLVDTDPECAIIHVPSDQTTIQGAINAHGDGSLILAAPGTYVENLDFLGKAITVQSEAGSAVTTIDGNHTWPVVAFYSGETEAAVLDGFTLRNGYSREGGGIYCAGSSPAIKRCVITGNTASSGGAIYSYWAEPVITNCLIVENRAAKGAGIYSEQSWPQFTNCTFSGNIATENGGAAHCQATSMSMTNCILWGDTAPSGSEFYLFSGTGYPQVSFSDVQGGWDGEGNIDADPLFISGGDYHLTMSSPCIDTGTDAGVDVDIDGDGRPQGAGFDMGAYEYPVCWDADLDGYGDAACGGFDCDDADPGINPGAEEICLGGVDEDCDGLVDSEEPACVTIHVPSGAPTIQYAITAVEEGNRILVAPGTYTERLYLAGKAITLQSEAGAGSTVIDGTQTGRAVTINYFGTGDVVIDGFTIRNGRSSKGGGILCSSPLSPSSAKIMNCRISGNVASEGGGIYCEQDSDPTVMNCTITGNMAENGGGVFCADGSSPAIASCTISGNYTSGQGGGLYCHSSSPTIANCMIVKNFAAVEGGGLFSKDSAVDITNCTLSKNFGYQHGGGFYCYGSASDITNCILWGNNALQGQEIYTPSGIPTVRYSDVRGGWYGEGNIDADPLFAGSGDLHLTFSSPCIDSGTDVEIYTDLEGDPRPTGAGFDMGADEYPDCGDADMDGFGDAACGGYDCDDSAADVSPIADEVCDAIDHDCNGDPFDKDGDGDGFIDADPVCMGDDCDDEDPAFHPGALEICDGKDTDCDGTVPDGEADGDGDGWMICAGDCDDSNPAISPEAAEICDNGIDDNCDDLTDEDDPDCVQGTQWEKYPGNPVLHVGPAGTWDEVEVSFASALFDGTEYRIWYVGTDADSRSRIGYATSPDGIAWTKYAGNPVLPVGPEGAWDHAKVSHPSVLFDGVEYRMWYGGFDGLAWRIGCASSPDGIAWTKHAGNPVLNLGLERAWDDGHISGASVLFEGSEYKMWYTGNNQFHSRIGHATSPDGIVWTKYAGNPVLNKGPFGAWDYYRVSDPSIFFDGSGYHMWYAGHDLFNVRVGHATSPDGIVWTKYIDNPVLDLGPSGYWEDEMVRAPMVLFEGTSYKMWYGGADGENERIGYAVSSVN